MNHTKMASGIGMNTNAPVSDSLPGKRDPRWIFGGLLLLYAIAGFTVLGFNRDPQQVFTTLLACVVLEVGFARVLVGRWIFPLSAFITGLGLSLLVNYPHDPFLMFLPAFFAISSKYLLTQGGRHRFNPGLCGLLAALVLGGGKFATSPPYQWGDQPLVAGLFLGAAACAGFVGKIHRNPLIISFLVSFLLLTALRAWLMRWHLPPVTLLQGTLTSPAFFLFTFYMITDPKTSPQGTRAQIVWGIAVAVLDLLLHLKSSLATLFYALFLVSAAHWLSLHVMALRAGGWRACLPSALWLKRLVTISAVGGMGWAAYAMVLHPQVIAPPLRFAFEKSIPLDGAMGDALTRVDPRIAHVAKWVLSVGDAAAVGDYDNDGLPDLFLTYPLKQADQRNTLLRNKGGFRFERVPIPALDEISAHPEKHGLVAGALWVDYDASGRQSLLLITGWGKIRLLQNRGGTAEKPDFVDVTEAVGIDEYTVSVAATFADFDLDGDLDLFIGNAMAPQLADYDPPRAFNIFSLPEAEYEGDRRMYHFMHQTWHNARNGGKNVFLRQVAPGRFQREDMYALGMPETHWTMAVGTADFNQDGWPDLYCASDYGPDDLYLNQAGRGFHRVAGTFSGSIGRDTYKGMNVSIGDLDNRGWQDIYVSNVHAPLQAEGSLLWRTEPEAKAAGGVTFHDAASSRRVLNESRFGWGAAMGDLNLDGWLDIVQVNGMVDDSADKVFPEPRHYWYRASQVMRSGPEVHSYADRWADLRGYEIWGRQQNRVYLSHGGEPARFVDVADGVGLTEKTNARAAALADFDNDGDLDLVITHQFAPAEIRRNTLMEQAGEHKPRWIGFLLQGDGRTVARDAIGAQLMVKTSAGQQMREVSLTSGFSAQSDRRMHFGLGEQEGSIDVTIRWPGGETQEWKGLAPQTYHTIHYRKTKP